MAEFRPTVLALFQEVRGVVEPTPPNGELYVYGISLKWLKDKGIESTEDQLRALTEERAMEYYHSFNWLPHKDEYESLHFQHLADRIFITAHYTQDFRLAVQLVQRAARSCGKTIKDDGILGDQTRTALESCDENTLLACFRSELAGHYRTLVAVNQTLRTYKIQPELPDLSDKTRGWLNRAYGNDL